MYHVFQSNKNMQNVSEKAHQWILVALPVLSFYLSTRNISIKFLQQSVRPSYGGYLCPQSAEFQNLLFGVLRRKSCRCGCVIIVLVFSLLLSQFQLDFVSFVTISAVLCHCSKTMYVACQNFTLTGPCQLIIFHNQLLLCFGLSFDQSYHH